MKLYWLLPLMLINGCSNADEKQLPSKESAACQLSFTNKTLCEYQGYKIELKTKTIETDEIELVSLLVSYQQKEHELIISAETSMLDDDIGFIYFEDINFDGVAEPAITTSFGTANLYLDYWVLDTVKNQFDYIGNHSQFKLDLNNKKLTNTVKLNAATYQSCDYSWKGFKLEKNCQ